MLDVHAGFSDRTSNGQQSPKVSAHLADGATLKFAIKDLAS